MELSVVIPCYNAAGTIERQLDALAGQQWSERWEIILSDNGSTDETVGIADRYKRRLPSLRVVDSGDRQGAAHAKNVGAMNAVGKALAFCDADDEVAPGWVEAMGEALREHDFVAGRLDVEKLNPAWAQKARGKIQYEGLQGVCYPPYLPHAASANLGIKRSLHESVGGFDESMACLEDTDYCFRVQIAGTGLHFVPGAIVNYQYRHTLSGIYRQSRDYARYRIFLSKRYQSMGPSFKEPWKTYLGDWRKLFRKCLTIRTKENLGGWMWLLGRQVGRTRGCLEFRVPPV